MNRLAAIVTVTAMQCNDSVPVIEDGGHCFYDSGFDTGYELSMVDVDEIGKALEDPVYTIDESQITVSAGNGLLHGSPDDGYTLHIDTVSGDLNVAFDSSCWPLAEWNTAYRVHKSTTCYTVSKLEDDLLMVQLYSPNDLERGFTREGRQLSSMERGLLSALNDATTEMTQTSRYIEFCAFRELPLDSVLCGEYFGRVAPVIEYRK